ncbi:MAG: GNAT family N-acetyltransferase [Dehalococcoidia bacterium]|nr:GNAT family N-acetyltransferase [Dehalococcoidia bacterium]
MIRTATKNDIDAVYGLIKQLSNHGFTKEQFERCYEHNLKSEYVLVCEQDSKILGCGVLRINYPLPLSQKVAEIVNLVVDESFRNRGIGKELLEVFEKIAADHRCICITVISGKQREAAHRFYTREGFELNHYKFTKEII